MAKRSGPPPIIFILAFLLLAGGGYWFFFMRNQQPQTVTNVPPSGSATAPQASGVTSTFPAPVNVASGTTIRVDGSTSMVTINQNLKNSFERQFPGTQVITNARGSSQGIQSLLAGAADVAAVSRPLNGQEQAQGLQAVPIALDKIAVVVGADNSLLPRIDFRASKRDFSGANN